MKWIKIDKTLDKMRKTYPQLPYTDYGIGHYKPFFPLFKVGEFYYVTQVSSKKASHKSLNDTKDFTKLYGRNGEDIGTVNTCFMFPVLKQNIKSLSDDNLRNIYRQVKDPVSVEKQINFLHIFKQSIKDKQINEKAMNLYHFVQLYPLHRTSQRCLDFKELEAKCIEINLQEELQNDNVQVLREKELFIIQVEENEFVKTYSSLFPFKDLVEEIQEEVNLQPENANYIEV